MQARQSTTGAGDDPLGAWAGLPVGFRFPPFDATLTAERQARYHRLVGIGDEVFGEQADASLLSHATVAVLRPAGLPVDGRVLLSHDIRQTRPIRLGELVGMQGEILPWADSPRGRIVHCQFRYRTAAGDEPLRVNMRGLLPDPSATPGPRPAPPAEGAAEWQPVGRLPLTPQAVAAFGAEVGNRIHDDPDFARARGFRAPIAQGLMQLMALYGALAREGRPSRVTFAARFLRPAFWDEELRLEADAARTRYRAVNAGGKATVAAAASDLERV